ncbi:MAG: hypothetical protein EOM20_16025 [Spartobacteria bacterium]|nr:hypothetical protein [Spartobacteria bacterium]
MKIVKHGMWMGLSVLFICSCAKEPEVPRVFETITYTQTNEIVQKAEIQLEPEKFVEVDFNADGLMDLAVIEEPDDKKATLTDTPTNAVPDAQEEEETKAPRKSSLFEMFKKKGITIPRSQLTIYIQESDGKYYLGGKIIDVKEGEIIGLAYKQNDTRYYDLLLVYDYGKGVTEVVRYENDGTGFTMLGNTPVETVTE